MPSATLLLPPRLRFAGEPLPAAIARRLGRADPVTVRAGAQSLFDVLPRGWPVAAVARQHERGDAAGAAWVRADPAYVRPDINGARLLAIGEALQLAEEEAEALLRALRPLFGDAGMPIEATSPSSWYLRLDPGTPLPSLTDPDQALGADIFDHLPPGDAGRRWRALLSEAQVTLHQHPLNADRAARGLAPVNSVWFWGAGRLPDRVDTAFASIASGDAGVRAFAAAAGVGAAAVPSAWPGDPETPAAFDLRHERALDALCARWVEPALDAVRRGRLGELTLAFDDGGGFRLRRSQSLRFWRRPLRVLAERDAP